MTRGRTVQLFDSRQRQEFFSNRIQTGCEAPPDLLSSAHQGLLSHVMLTTDPYLVLRLEMRGIIVPRHHVVLN